MNKGVTAKSYLRTLNIIYWAQIASIVIFGAVVLFLTDGNMKPDDELVILQYPLLGLFITGLAASRLIPAYLIKKISPTLALKQKIRGYANIMIIRTACLEVPGWFACVVAFLTYQLYYLAVVPLLLIILLLYRPTTGRIAEELSLTLAERAQLEEP